MYEIAIISLLIIIVLLILIAIFYAGSLYYEYNNDKNNREETKDAIKKLAVIILTREGVDTSQLTAEETKPKKKTGFFKLFGNS